MSTGTMTKPSAGGVKPGQDPALAKWENPTDKKGLDALGEIVKVQLVNALPSFMANRATAARLVRCLITECQGTPALMECTPISLFSCCIRAAQLGWEIGGPLGRAYLIPFKNNKNNGKKEAQLIPGYKGLIELAHRSGQIKRITPIAVRKGDTYIVERGLDQQLIHKPLPGNTAPAFAYYVVIELMTGGKDFEEFTVEQAIAHRNRYAMSKSSGPWQDIQIEVDAAGKFTKIVPGEAFNAMALKTLIRKFMKRTPMSAELTTATEMEDDVENDKAQLVPKIGGEMPDLLGSGPVDDEPEPDKADQLGDRLDAEKAAGGGDPNAPTDFLTPAIDGYKAVGGLPEELAEHHKTTMAVIRKSTGKDRAAWTDVFTKAAKEIEDADARK